MILILLSVISRIALIRMLYILLNFILLSTIKCRSDNGVEQNDVAPYQADLSFSSCLSMELGKTPEGVSLLFVRFNRSNNIFGRKLEKTVERRFPEWAAAKLKKNKGKKYRSWSH